KALGQALDQIRTAVPLAFKARFAEEQSSNATALRRYEEKLAASLTKVEKQLAAVADQIVEAQDVIAQARQTIAPAHASHASDLSRLNAANEAASEQARERATLEQQVAKLQGIEEQRLEQNNDLKKLMEQRRSLKASHILMRDQISTLR